MAKRTVTAWITIKAEVEVEDNESNHNEAVREDIAHNADYDVNHASDVCEVVDTEMMDVEIQDAE